jgi:hypothetical protein
MGTVRALHDHMSRLLLSLLAVSLFALTGCKKHYSSNCSRGVDLVAPWSALTLPTGDGRVCSSTDRKTDIEHLSGTEAEWEKRYEDALLAQGYTKDRCSSLACDYLKAGEKVNVHANQVATGRKAKTIVHLTRTPPRS